MVIVIIFHWCKLVHVNHRCWKIGQFHFCCLFIYDEGFYFVVGSHPTIIYQNVLGFNHVLLHSQHLFKMDSAFFCCKNKSFFLSFLGRNCLFFTFNRKHNTQAFQDPITYLFKMFDWTCTYHPLLYLPLGFLHTASSVL